MRLATQIGARMQGLVYVLDEPSVGLHQSDNARLIETLVSIRDSGNTVVVVEHDEETIRAADWVLDLGEGAGEGGGRLMYSGPPGSIDGSLTGRYLRGELEVAVPAGAPAGPRLARACWAPAPTTCATSTPRSRSAALTAVTGVSGSGKSTLVEDVLHRTLAQRLYRATAEPGRHRALEGVEAIDKVIAIDQSPIGRTPRSNPATYTGAFALDPRALQPGAGGARARLSAGRFSFNVKGGRCEACQGDGVRRVEMHFLPDVFVPCEACHGRRYNRETLEVRYQGLSIADVLELTVDEARELLARAPAARSACSRRSARSASATCGSARTRRRSRAARRSACGSRASSAAARPAARSTCSTSRPRACTSTTCGGCSRCSARLVDAGNTVVVIEHNLDVVKCADWVIDLGPGRGRRGRPRRRRRARPRRSPVPGAATRLATCGRCSRGRGGDRPESWPQQPHASKAWPREPHRASRASTHKLLISQRSRLELRPAHGLLRPARASCVISPNGDGSTWFIAVR